MDTGLKATPLAGSFFRFTSKGIWTPDGSIHGVDFGSILMTNIALGIEDEKVPYVNDGSVVNAAREAVMFSPDWTIEGNQYQTPIRALLMGGTKNADVVQASATAATQTINGAKIGNTYDLGVRGLVTWTSLQPAPSGTAYVRDVDYEVDLKNGTFRILEGGAIADNTNVKATYDVPAITREDYTAFNNQNQSGTLKLFGIRTISGYTAPGEEGTIKGTLFPESMGDIDPKKHRSWKMKLAAIGFPNFRYLKT